MKGLLKFLLLTVVAVLLGAIPAYLYHQQKISSTNERFYWNQWDQSTEGKAKGKISIASGNRVDFGKLAEANTIFREIILENIGGQNVEVWVEKNSSRIVQVDFPTTRTTIAPGSSYPVSFSVDSSEVKGDLNASIMFKTSAEQTLEIELIGNK